MGQPPLSASEDNLFSRIALSLSGGGFRASAYSLGTFKALYLLGLLENVHMLSTASGGTITGAYYAMRRKQGHAFETIYHDFYALLEQDAILPHALSRWQEAIGANEPHYKLIQAFADTYNQELYGGARLGLFWEPDEVAHAPFHLQSIIFGATEMYTGLTFRFQHGAYLPPPKGKARESYAIGNGNVSIPTEYARKLRLGDIVAASSCFPGGFEPLVLPDDFFPGAAHPDMLTKGNKRTSDSVALLDGGIYDNQGIDSLLLANERNSRHVQKVRQSHSPQQAALLLPTTLFLVADVGGADKDIYQAPALKKASRFSPALWQLLVLAVLLVVGCVVAAWQLKLTGTHLFLSGLLTGLALLGAAGLAFLALGGLKLQAVLRKKGAQVPGWFLPRLARLSVSQLWQLVVLRGGSTFKLLTSVFMRRVRSQSYEQLYTQSADRTPPYEVLSSIIGRIANDYERQAAQPGKKAKQTPAKEPKVQEQLAAVYDTIRQAHEMGTTLWWQHNIYRMPAIVASAEITLCYQLLRRFEKTPPRPDTQEAEVQRRAKLLWEAYQTGGKGFLVPVNALAVLQDPACTVAQVLACARP